MDEFGKPREIRPVGKRWLAVLPLALLLCRCCAIGQEGQFFQHPFRVARNLLAHRPADAGYKQLTHQVTDETAHGGQRSELIELEAQQGNFIHYVFPVGQALVTESSPSASGSRPTGPAFRCSPGWSCPPSATRRTSTSR